MPIGQTSTIWFSGSYPESNSPLMLNLLHQILADMNQSDLALNYKLDSLHAIRRHTKNFLKSFLKTIFVVQLCKICKFMKFQRVRWLVGIGFIFKLKHMPARLEQDLKSYQLSQDKENIRRTHQMLGDHYHDCGDLRYLVLNSLNSSRYKTTGIFHYNDPRYCYHTTE